MALTLGLFLAACSSAGTSKPGPAQGSAQGPIVHSWVTTGDQSQRLSAQPGRQFGTAALQPLRIEVDTARRYQVMAGFGASITDATAWLMQNRMSGPQREALLQELFSREGKGIGLDFTRLTIGASDFSRSHYSLNDLPPGQTDMALSRFSLDANRADVLPVVKRALALNPRLNVMASPWSAPGWMKTSGSLVKGTLKPGMEDVFSRYMVRYVEAMAAEGVPIFALTLQNEPHFEPDNYPGMRLDPPQRARLIGQHLGPMLAQRGLKVQLFDWDHNWDEPQSPLAVLADPAARPFVAGVAWHCYAGDVKAQGQVHDAFPDKDVWFTECSGGEWNTRWSESLPWMVRNLIIGSTRGWARGVLMWNLALDEDHGPHLGGCNDCRGVVTINSRTGGVTRNLEYYALAHASKFVRQGARRVESTAAVDTLETVAFQNADDGSVVLIVCNSGPAERAASIVQGGQSVRVVFPRESIATLVWVPATTP
jgi:glucosylceramidase